MSNQRIANQGANNRTLGSGANSDATGVVREVRSAQIIDERALLDYLRDRVEGIKDSLRVRQFDGGQSNPTYLLESENRRWVLRKKPAGQLLATAHMIEREYRITSALAATGFPAAKPLLWCDDVSIIGTAFYVVEYVHGRILRDPSLPEMSMTDRGTAYRSMVATLASLHSVDVGAVGLGDFGKPDGYVARQIARWTKQYQASKERDVPAMEWLIDWLPKHVPTQTSAAIVHGDFRIDNMIFHPSEPRVIAVLDWELSTIGEPLTDVAYHCLAFHLRREQRGVPGLLGHDFAALGIPSESEIVADYCRARGISGIENWNFNVAFALFRLASIAEGVYARMRQGNATTDAAASVAGESAAFAEAAKRVLMQG
jgi:aminoglycoside phosphotransferase (APT) family kinase protein